MAAFRVARELGVFVEDVLDNMSALEFSEWLAILFPQEEAASTEDIEKAFKASFGVVKK